MAEEPEDDNKRKFREALERKKANAGGGSAHKDAGNKQPKAHGPETARRIVGWFDLEDLGDRELKNVEEPVRVFRLATAAASLAA